MHCVAEARVSHRRNEGTFGVHGGDAHLDTKYVTTPICWVVIRNENGANDGFERTHETVSDRFIITDDALGVGAGWTRLFGSVDMQKPTLIPAFTVPYGYCISQCSGIGCKPEGDEGERDGPAR